MDYESKEAIENMLHSYDNGSRYNPRDIVDNIVSSQQLSNSEKVLYLSQFKNSTLAKISESVPGSDPLTTEFVKQYETDLKKYEDAEAIRDKAYNSELQYADIERGYANLNRSFRTMRRELGPDADLMVPKLDVIIKQCIKEKDMKAFDEFAKDSNLNSANETFFFRQELEYMTKKCDIDLVNKYNDNRREFIQEWQKKHTDKLNANLNLRQTEIDIRKKYMKVPETDRKKEVILAVTNNKMLLPKDHAAYQEFLGQIVRAEGMIWSPKTEKRFVDEVYNFIEKRIAEGKIQEPDIMYNGEKMKGYEDFAQSAKRCIDEKRPLSELKLPVQHEEHLIFNHGRLPQTYDLELMKSAMEVSEIRKQTIKVQAEENVGTKSDGSGQDKLAEKGNKTYDERKTALDARIISNMKSGLSK